MNRLKVSDPQNYNKICFLSLKVKKKAKDLNISYRLLEKKKHPLGWLIAGLAGLFLTFPVWLFGNIFTLTFLSLPELQIRKTKDLQFHSTIRFGISLALAFIFLPIYLVISLIIFSPWWLALIIFLTIPVAGIFAWNYNILFRRIIVGFRLRKYIRENNPDYSDLRKNYDELIELVSAMKDNEK
jgi:hypothetical protein